jgi:hypothetical protein
LKYADEFGSVDYQKHHQKQHHRSHHSHHHHARGIKTKLLKNCHHFTQTEFYEEAGTTASYDEIYLPVNLIICHKFREF